MAGEEPHVVLLKDRLSATTRNARKGLLVSSIVSYLIATAGLLPTKIAFLGIDFIGPNSVGSMRIALGLVIGFFLIEYALYAVSDWLMGGIAFGGVMREKLEAAMKLEGDPAEAAWQDRVREVMERSYPVGWFYARNVKRVAVVRDAFDILVPILWGTFVVVVLVLPAFKR
jgi:hypothetical protein